MAYLFRPVSGRKGKEMDIKERENARMWSAFIGLRTEPVPAVVSMGMNFWFLRFGIISQIAVQILSTQGGLCIIGKTIIAVY